MKYEQIYLIKITNLIWQRMDKIFVSFYVMWNQLLGKLNGLQLECVCKDRFSRFSFKLSSKQNIQRIFRERFFESFVTCRKFTLQKYVLLCCDILTFKFEEMMMQVWERCDY
eukprot:TRINITY_DN51611_c0_g1_i1.p3 TRINITY_DN51611_c0_g1~~TRINITY_DN51611_c0_g1_i1.p3  ORF type:complete len:112 (+),score=3.36 TRINITY_DN51611_c0_g1_i1:414-749(+)